MKFHSERANSLNYHTQVPFLNSFFPHKYFFILFFLISFLQKFFLVLRLGDIPTEQLQVRERERAKLFWTTCFDQFLMKFN